MLLERLCLTTVPYICMKCMCYHVLFTVPFITKRSPLWMAQRGTTPLIFPINQFCGITVLWWDVGFGLCSQLWQGYLSAVVSSPNAPAVTLRICLSPLHFSSSKLCLTEVHLKRIYKRQEIATFRWRDIKCRVWIHMWTGLVSVSVCVTEFVLVDKA